MLSYRGYSGSTGQPSERANVADAKLAYDALIAEGVAPDDIILYGESLGSGIAVQLAAEKPVGGVVLDAPYTSIVDVAAGAYPVLSRALVPVRPLRDPALPAGRDTRRCSSSTARTTRSSPSPWGARSMLPPMGRRRSSTFPGAGHSDHHLYGSGEEVFRWIDALSGPRARARRRKANAPLEHSGRMIVAHSRCERRAGRKRSAFSGAARSRTAAARSTALRGAAARCHRRLAGQQALALQRACGRACARGARPRPFPEPCARTASRNSCGASSPGKCPRAASSS